MIEEETFLDEYATFMYKESQYYNLLTNNGKNIVPKYRAYKQVYKGRPPFVLKNAYRITHEGNGKYKISPNKTLVDRYPKMFIKSDI